jgi:hypothetical protein
MRHYWYECIILIFKNCSELVVVLHCCSFTHNLYSNPEVFFFINLFDVESVALVFMWKTDD